MPLTATDKRRLRSMAHSLKPVVLTGARGMTDAVLNEVDIALEHHELIKVRLQAPDREHLQQCISILCEHSNAELVQLIGHVAVIYRKSKKHS